jgi:uncharacterized protein (DUF362 family)
MGSRVLLVHCDTYDASRIEEIVFQGLTELGLTPKGRTLVKPNAVLAHPRFFPYSSTRAEFLDGVLRALKRRGGYEHLSVGERCGITVPTRFSFRMAGYFSVLERLGVPAELFDEMVQVPVKLPPRALRPYIFLPEAVARTDFLVNVPKFKAHPWTKVTFALKNYIGIQDDRHRLVDHDHMLHTKIADLHEAVPTRFVAMDAITAGQKRMLTPEPFPLNLVIMGDNAVAVDAVSSRIVGLEPEAVDHIRIAHERGMGPVSLSEIEIGGDVTLEKAKARAKGFGLSLERVEKVFSNEGSTVRAVAGPPPDPHIWGQDYCWGGCPGAIQEAIEIVRMIQPGVYKEVAPMLAVFGKIEQPLEVKPGERVFFIGDCAQYRGPVGNEQVDIPFLYKTREKIDPRHAQSVDLVRKVVGYVVNLVRHAGKPYVRVRGCPVSVAENVLYLSYPGGTKNPYLLPAISVPFAFAYVSQKVRRFFALLGAKLRGGPAFDFQGAQREWDAGRGKEPAPKREGHG